MKPVAFCSQKQNADRPSCDLSQNAALTISHPTREGTEFADLFFQYERHATPGDLNPRTLKHYRGGMLAGFRENRAKIVRAVSAEMGRGPEVVASPRNNCLKIADPLFTSRALAYVRLGMLPATQFPCSVAARIYLYFKATSVLDPYAGWGNRLLAALALATDSNKRCAYLGCDSNPRLAAPYREMLELLAEYRGEVSVDVGSAKIFVGRRCEDVLLERTQSSPNDPTFRSDRVPPFDLLFSSPPFYSRCPRKTDYDGNKKIVPKGSMATGAVEDETSPPESSPLKGEDSGGEVSVAATVSSASSSSSVVAAPPAAADYRTTKTPTADRFHLREAYTNCEADYETFMRDSLVPITLAALARTDPRTGQGFSPWVCYHVYPETARRLSAAIGLQPEKEVRFCASIGSRERFDTIYCWRRRGPEGGGGGAGSSSGGMYEPEAKRLKK